MEDHSQISTEPDDPDIGTWTWVKSIKKLLTFSVWEERKLSYCKINAYLKGIFRLWLAWASLLAFVIFFIVTVFYLFLSHDVMLPSSWGARFHTAVVHGSLFSICGVTTYSILFFLKSHKIIKYDIADMYAEKKKEIRMMKFKIPLTN